MKGCWIVSRLGVGGGVRGPESHIAPVLLKPNATQTIQTDGHGVEVNKWERENSRRTVFRFRRFAILFGMERVLTLACAIHPTNTLQPDATACQTLVGLLLNYNTALGPWAHAYIYKIVQQCHVRETMGLGPSMYI